MWYEIIRAIGLVLVIEGIIPFLYPKRWRGLVATLAKVDDRSLRRMGLFSMLLGVGMMYLVWTINS